MSTEKQTNANRENAQSSTGPKTDEGKAIASQNAVKHGFFAKNDVILGEDPAAYEQHRADIYDEYFPMTPTESVLTQRIASLTWRLMRADRLQTTTINTLVTRGQSETPLSEEERHWVENFNAAVERTGEPLPPEGAEMSTEFAAKMLHELAQVPSDKRPKYRPPYEPPTGPTICKAEIKLGGIIYDDFLTSKVLERLSIYERRIEHSLFKTIRLIDQLQQNRRKADAAQEKRDWAYLKQEDEAKRNRKEAEHRQRIHNATMQNEPNPDPHCHSERRAAERSAAAQSRGIRKNTIAEGDSKQKTALAEGQSRFIGEPNHNPLAEGQSRRAGEPNPNPACHSERRAAERSAAAQSRGIHTNIIAEGDSKQKTALAEGQSRRAGEPNPELTSISEITYNRSRQEKAKRNQSEDPTHRDNPDRSDNK